MIAYLGKLQSVLAWTLGEHEALEGVLKAARSIIDGSYKPAERVSAAEKQYENACFLLSACEVSNTPAKLERMLEKAEQRFRNFTEEHPSDYRGWLGLAKINCMRQPSTFEEAAELLEEADDCYDYVIAAGGRESAEAEYTKALRPLIDRTAELCCFSAEKCKSVEEIKALAEKFSNMYPVFTREGVMDDEKYNITLHYIKNRLYEVLSDEFTRYVYYKVVYGDTIITGLRNGHREDIFIPKTIDGSLVRRIGKGAFIGNKILTSVTIPDSVTHIGSSAFSGCESLTSVTIPDSVTEIGWGVFSGCKSLTSITIPDSVTKIGSYAFLGCESLTSITIPDSVTEIEWKAFSGCESLTSITIPDSVTEIKNEAFEGCKSLTSITIPDSVTEIEWEAFSGCKSLTSITIPDSVTEIGWGVFSGCDNVTVYCGEDSNAWKYCEEKGVKHARP